MGYIYSIKNAVIILITMGSTNSIWRPLPRMPPLPFPDECIICTDLCSTGMPCNRCSHQPIHPQCLSTHIMTSSSLECFTCRSQNIYHTREIRALQVMNNLAIPPRLSIPPRLPPVSLQIPYRISFHFTPPRRPQPIIIWQTINKFTICGLLLSGIILFAFTVFILIAWLTGDSEKLHALINVPYIMVIASSSFLFMGLIMLKMHIKNKI